MRAPEVKQLILEVMILQKRQIWKLHVEPVSVNPRHTELDFDIVTF